MADYQNNYASKGTAGAGLGLGIAGTALGLLGNTGLLNGIFGGGNRVSALESELAQQKAERYTDQQTLKSQRETFTEFRAADEKLASVLEKVTSGFLEVGNAVSQMNKEIECLKTTMAKNQEINDLKLKATEDRLSGAIALESERRASGDQNLYCYVNATFVPGNLVMPASKVSPEPMPLYNSWTAPTGTEQAGTATVARAK